MRTPSPARLLPALGLALSTLLSVAMAPAQAALVLADDSSFGSQAVVHDTASELEWLRLDFSYGLTYNTVASQLGSGQTFDGWSIATTSVLSTLLGTPNGINQGDNGAAAVAAAASLRDMICFTANTCKYPSSTHHVALGLVSDLYDGGSFMAQRLFTAGVILDDGSGTPAVDFRSSGWHAADAPAFGVWLFRGERQATVPEPGNLALLLAGAAALGFSRRRGRRCPQGAG